MKLRKTLSFLISITLIISTVCIFTNSAVSAENTDVSITKNNGSVVNTYDELNVDYFYRNSLLTATDSNNDVEADSNAATDRLVNGIVENTDFARNGIYIEKYTDTENYAAHFGVAYNYSKYTTGYWSCARMNTLRIYDSNNKNLAYFTPKANTTYVFKMEYRVDTAPNRTMGFKLMYENDSVDSVFYEYTEENLIKNNIVTFSDVTDGWQTAEFTFTTGETVKPLLLMLYTNNTGWHSTVVDVWVDNIEVYESAVKNTYVDFNTAQSEWYASNSICYASSGTVADSNDSNYGNAFNLLGVLSENDTTYGQNIWYSGHPSAFTLMNETATNALYYKAGEALEISFMLKTDTAFAGMGKDEFYVSLISMDSTNTHLGDFIRNYINDGRVVNVATVPNAVTEDWVEYSATVTVPHDGYIGMMFYSYGTRAYGSVFIDNVSVNKVDPEKETKINFSAEQTAYINTYNPSTTGAPTESGEESIGNVFQINYLVADHDDVNPGNKWYEAYPAGFYLVNNQADSVLYYKKGDVLNISFKIKKTVTMDQTYSDDFYVCAAFLETATTKFDFIEEQLLDTGILVRLATIDKNASDWVTYNATITVPCDGYGSMVFYTTNRRTGPDCGIWVDDVSIDKYETSTYERTGDINSDGNVNLKDLVLLKKISANISESTTVADLDFNGNIGNAQDITKLRKRILGVENTSMYMLGDVQNLSKINMQGRWDANELGVTLDWSASALEFSANCKGRVGIVLNTDIYWENAENIINYAVYVDGVRNENTVSVGNGVTYVELADNLPDGEHTFSLVRLTDAYYGNTDAIAIELDGTLNDNADNKQMIEFIGDSITVGGGNLGDSTVGSDVGSYPSYQDATKTYAYLTAKALGYDYSISARSGIALYYGYGHTDDETDACENFTDYYGIQNYFRDTEAKYLPKRDSDIICINLGTNDYWSGKCPDDASFTEKMVAFAKLVKKNSPNAKVVLLTGGINGNNVTAVNDAFTELGGEEAGYYVCNMTYGLTSGANNHPNVAEHELMASELIEFLKTIS